MIVTHKKISGRTIYLVRQRCYNTMVDSWLREKDLAIASDLL